MIRGESICINVNQLPEPQRCHYVLNTNDCTSNMNLVNYLDWHYCHLDTRNKFNTFWSVLFMAILLIYIFWMMQLAIIHHFCPLLKSIADALRLNESTAGVTVLAIANGSPDLFTTIAAGLPISSNSFLSCAAVTMFLHIFVAGLVMLTNPFYVEANYFIRDFGFLFVNTAYMDYLHKRREGIGLEHTIPAALIFIFYVATAVVDQQLLKSQVKALERKRSSFYDDYDDYDNELLENLMPQTQLPIRRHTVIRHSHTSGHRNKHLFLQFWRSIFLFNFARYREATFLVRAYLILKEPIEMALRLLIPVVDVEQPLHGWSKLLYVIQINLVPTYCSYILGEAVRVQMMPKINLPICFVVWVAVFPLSVIVFFCTRTDTRPKIFRFTSIFAFLGSILIIFILTSELYAMFFTLSTIMQMSHQFSTATVICWAVQSRSLVTNLNLAHQGWPRMAFTATFSSPVFTTFAFLALPLLFQTIKAYPDRYQPSEGSYGETACIFLEVGMFFSLISAMTTNFKMRRACGFLLVTYYLFYVGVLILLETQCIHPYGV
ncbi:mitochondrial sodium/calcium exchanger protein isoform X1 [Drosophila bipectinata]|uniref:mitochondrial sodium/calcium exchanger protein isoform X1 n=1 Tax=Drosophila bipectinata TaxID=42026 RepID=UPI001C8949AA|nr:mitochondrial sodium/calcium exchanger protein [Drosophila bipectinata]KAH8233511.1 hypothetical protein KR026_009125 [Drosophila bipectinata]